MENPITSNREENRCPLFVALNFVEVFDFFALFFGVFFVRWRTSAFQKHSDKNDPLSRLDPETPIRLLQLISVAQTVHPGRVPKKRKVSWCVINSNFPRL